AEPVATQLRCLEEEIERWWALGGTIKTLTVCVYGGFLDDEAHREMLLLARRRGLPAPSITHSLTSPQSIVTLTLDPAELPPALCTLLDAQREAFARRWSRPFHEGDPLFFDPDAESPTWLADAELWEALSRAAYAQGLEAAWVAKVLGYPVGRKGSR
ncbi:MAG: hypothetical protein ACE5NC_12390, partial [Anaerolineae bacterium]